MEAKSDEPLTLNAKVAPRVYSVEYDVLNLICFECGQIGLWEENCAENTWAARESDPVQREKDDGVHMPMEAT